MELNNKAVHFMNDTKLNNYKKVLEARIQYYELKVRIKNEEIEVLKKLATALMDSGDFEEASSYLDNANTLKSRANLYNDSAIKLGTDLLDVNNEIKNRNKKEEEK